MNKFCEKVKLWSSTFLSQYSDIIPNQDILTQCLASISKSLSIARSSEAELGLNVFSSKNTSSIDARFWCFDAMLKYGIMPVNFNNSVISPIPKAREKGDDPSNFRLISVSTTFSMTFEQLIYNKIKLSIHRN